MAKSKEKAADSAQVRRLREALAREKAKSAQFAKERAEAREQQVAAAEILKVISRSPDNAQPVFDAIVKCARKLLGGHSAVLTRFAGGVFHLAAFTSTSESGDGLVRATYPLPLAKHPRLARVVRLRAPYVVSDTEKVSAKFAQTMKMGRTRGYRSVIGVPLLRERNVIGTISVTRREPGIFTRHEIRLLQTFAQQAVIAIENVRRFNETKEGLERQTATAEILKVISASPTDISPVFKAIASSATRLCDASFCVVFRFDGTTISVAADDGRVPGTLDVIRSAYPAPPGNQSFSARAIQERRVISIVDAQNMPDHPEQAKRARAIGYRSILAVPMMKGDAAIGVINVARLEVNPFTDAQVELLKTFADQAVIAIENVRLFNETKEALERQTATAEILKVIASSPSDVQPVFDAIAASAKRLLAGGAALVNRRDGEMLHLMAYTKTGDAGDAALESLFPAQITGQGHAGKAILSGRPVLISDIETEPGYSDAFRASARTRGLRSVVSVPLLRDGEAIGVISVNRPIAGNFSEHQTNLLRTFADQAVIAIENVRLFNETKEALERQTATAEILKVISGSPTDVQPVFDAIARSAQLLIGGLSAAVLRVSDDQFHLAAFTATGQSGDEALKAMFPHALRSGGITAKAVQSGRPVVRTDTESDPEMPPDLREVARARGFRSHMAVPMIRDGVAIGAISVTRREPGAFSDHQIALLETFADQAVIAIENVRLFNETRESLERQTATADVLRAISTSPTDTRPVFEAILERAAKLCGAENGILFRYSDGAFHALATRIPNPEFAPLFREPRRPPPGSKNGLARIRDSKRVVHIPDMLSDAATLENDPLRVQTIKGGMRSWLGVPLLKEGELAGAIAIYRSEPQPFTAAQIALLETFAEQAVIAIENVRLFNETKEALERQTATAEILKVMAGSPTDVQPVFDVIVERAVKLCGARFGRVYRYDGSIVQMVAGHGLSTAGLQTVQRVFPRPAAEDTIVGQVILARQPFFLKDIQHDSTVPILSRQMIEALNTRSQVTIPMLRAGEPIGAITMGWDAPDGFDDRQVALLQTFADQAVIAIENVRLFNETKEALERQTATAEILRVIASSPSDVQPVFDAIVRSAARLVEPWAATITIVAGDQTHWKATAAFHDTDLVMERTKAIYPLPLDPERSPSARAILERRIIEIHDTTGPDTPEFTKVAQQVSGLRSITFVPLTREDRGIGAIILASPQAGSRLSEKQLGLIKTFADQAVIAIENVRLFNETKDALERQTATAEILRVIAGSPSDVQPVFDAICDSIARLFDRKAALRTLEPEGLRRRARSYEPTPGEFHGPDVEALDDRSIVGQAVLEGRAMQWVDTLVDGAARYSMEKAQALAFRAIASAPLMRDGKPIGVISVSSPQPGALSDKQMQLLSTFADQAVIAIENVRLFNETRDALERQTATAEVLRVISNSPTDTQPVFEAIAQGGLRLFPGAAVAVVLPDGQLGRAAAIATDSPEQAISWRARFPHPLTKDYMHGTAILERRLIDVPDVEAEVSGAMGVGARNFLASGNKAVTIVPMIRGDSAIGAISVVRAATGSLKASQIALLQTFADQAVIAIENVRLFNETKEALERQTSTADILKVIASSPSDVQPVFDAILERATRLCEAQLGFVFACDGRAFDLVAQRGLDEERLPAVTSVLIANRVPGPRTALGSVLSKRQVVHVPDIVGTAAYRARDPLHISTVDVIGARTLLAVPLLKDDAVVGAVVIYRREVKAFSDKQCATLQTFADQAVIAIENVRLFKELRTRTDALGKSVQKLTALGEVGQAISSTLDLEAVLKKIATHAVRLTGLDNASIYEYDEASEAFRLQAADNVDDELLEAVRRYPIRKGDGTVGGVAITREPVQVPDILDKTYRSTRKDLLIRAGYRAVLTVPLLREDGIMGALSVSRKTPGPFADEIVELMKTFATQSAMAIQNARLFREIAEKGKQLEEASRHKSQFLASMSHELRTPLNAILGFNEMILGDIYGEVPADMKEPLTDIQTSGKHLLRLINNVLDLAKIEAGRMELAVDDYSVHDTVESVRSTLRPLAEAKGLELAVDVPADIPLARGDGGRITQCLMNLAGNSLKFTKQGSVGIAVSLTNGTLTYKVQDTGIGIPADKIGGLFTEFKQTDATIASEYGGTGLGLSITKKFIEMHGGRIWAESEPGSGSTFVFEIPLRTGEAEEA